MFTLCMPVVYISECPPPLIMYILLYPPLLSYSREALVVCWQQCRPLYSSILCSLTLASRSTRGEYIYTVRWLFCDVHTTNRDRPAHYMFVAIRGTTIMCSCLLCPGMVLHNYAAYTNLSFWSLVDNKSKFVGIHCL